MPRILELSPEGLGPAHWVLWPLRTRKDPQPEGRRHGHGGTGRDGTGQDLILTENTRRLPPGGSFWGMPPHTSPATSRSISHPGVF